MSNTSDREAVAPPTSAPSGSDLYVGRFAPSPTGLLHFGSLLGALASFLDARANGGRWLVRIEDIDPPREQPGAARAILTTLANHGLLHDGEVLYQSQRIEAYRAVAEQLERNGLAYRCHCSRAWLAQHGGVHPPHCQQRDSEATAPFALRLRVSQGGRVGFVDRIQGLYEQELERAVGDFVIWRKEDLPAYQLAVVVDDAAQGVTDVVRGSDLLDNTPRQLHLQRLLGFRQPRYTHIPVISNRDGQKLSKQTFAAALVDSDALVNLRAALDFLGQPPPPHSAGSIAALLRWAADHWRSDAIPPRLSLAGDELPAGCRHFAT